jgi:diguanylate cyclase (GGDEF)-like protein
MRLPDMPQESTVPTERPSSDPFSSVTAAIEAVATGDDLDAILDDLLAAGEAATSSIMSAIVVADPDRDDLTVAAARGMDDAALAGLVDDLADPAHPFARAARTRETILDRAFSLPDGSALIGAYLPLALGNGGVQTAVGSIGFAWPAPADLDATVRRALAAIASLAAIAIARARLASTVAERTDWFERMAHLDPLTGLANERTVGQVLETELVRAARQGSEVSLVMFDIDDFQATNSESGHEAGDDVLRRVAAILAGSVRLVDTVGRVGGDEFVLIAPGSDGAVVAKRILDGISALTAVAGRQISVSAGVARFPADGGEAGTLIAAAKDGLTRAKHDGRGSVATAATPTA